MSDFALGDLEGQADREAGESRPSAPRRGEPSAPITSTLDLPLFKGPVDDQRPLVSAPAVPRAPLAVRRSGPLPAPPAVDFRVRKARAEPARAGAGRATARKVVEPELDLVFAAEGDREPVTPHRAAGASIEAPESGGATAGILARATAALIDAVLLGAINLAVLYFTLRLTGLTPSEFGILPPVPLFGFLLLLTGAYFVAFTAAGGQTIGKMATRIRVVPAGADEGATRVPLGHAVVRAAGYLVSLLPAGLGLLPALVGHERRALHDRLADTRVVKA
jgi:uncharacterized RDD family membrane protein YckC